MKIPLISMCGLLVLMAVLAVGFCMEFEQVDVTEGGNATLQFPTSGLTNFYEINCTTKSKITWIGKYCGTNESCTTGSSAPNVLIKPGRLILVNVTSNKCFSAKPIPGKWKYYNVTSKKPLRSTISPKKSNSNFSTATPFHTSTSDTSSESRAGVIAGGVVGGVVGVVILLFLAYLVYKFKKSRRKYGQVNVNAPV